LEILTCLANHENQRGHETSHRGKKPWRKRSWARCVRDRKAMSWAGGGIIRTFWPPYVFKIGLLELPIPTLNAIMWSNSMRIIDENWFLKVLIDIGLDHSLLFGHLRFKDRSSERILRFLRFNRFRSFDWRYCPASYLSFEGSRLQINFKIGDSFVKLFQDFSWKRFPDFRGFSANFEIGNWNYFIAELGKCDCRSYIITFIRTTKDFFFGGDSVLSSESTSGDKIDSSHQRVVFTITNPQNFESRKFELKLDQP
jgi:hypothetical protein